MRIGSLVKFTNALYSNWGLGLILREYDGNHKHLGYYYVMTQSGERLASDSFMEELSVDYETK